jgi:hypothetical protein
MTFKVGDRIRFNTNSNLGVQSDTMRGCFMQHVLLEPYARNEMRPALLLTEHSWCFVDDVVSG